MSRVFLGAVSSTGPREPVTNPISLPSSAIALALTLAAAGRSAAQPPVSLSQDGWTLGADPDQGRLAVAHEKLGTLWGARA